MFRFLFMRVVQLVVVVVVPALSVASSTAPGIVPSLHAASKDSSRDGMMGWDEIRRRDMWLGEMNYEF